MKSKLEWAVAWCVALPVYLVIVTIYWIAQGDIRDEVRS